MFEGHGSEKYTTRFPVYWKVMFDLCVVTGVVTRKQNVCVIYLIYHDKRNPQHQIKSHLIASQIIKNYTLNFVFYGHYSLYIIQVQTISHYVIS